MQAHNKFDEGDEMWSSFTIVSHDPPSAVCGRIAAVLTTTTGSGWLPGPITLRRQVSDLGFRVTRNISWGERTLPIVATGRFSATNGATAIKITTHPQVGVLLILAAWSLFWAQLLWRRLVSDPLPGGIHWGEIVVLVGFFAFGWGLSFVVCTIEERDYQRALERIIAPDVEPTSPADHSEPR